MKSFQRTSQNFNYFTYYLLMLSNNDRLTDLENAIRLMCDSVLFPPDYANMEATNRITAGGGTWTVEKRGYVFVYCSGDSMVQNGRRGFTVNGKEVMFAGGWLVGQTSEASAVLPVKSGDIVKNIHAYQSLGCHFIPPKIPKELFTYLT